MEAHLRAEDYPGGLPLAVVCVGGWRRVRDNGGGGTATQRRDLEYLAEGDERVILANLILLVHPEVVIRRDEDTQEVGVFLRSHRWRHGGAGRKCSNFP